jgi:hypothetical protein
VTEVPSAATDAPSDSGRNDADSDGSSRVCWHRRRAVLRRTTVQVSLVGRVRVERPWYAWVGVVLEVVTAIGAIPVGFMFLMDPTGKAVGVPQGWIEATVFGSYIVPGLYLLGMNGIGMVVVAALSARAHWIAPWLTGILGVGMMVWILVEILVLPETMPLTWVFLATGIAMGFVALFWLRRTGQLALW